MGTPKASLDWHGQTMLGRAAGILLRSVDGPVVIVRAPGQMLPAVPAVCEVVEDHREGRGPLEALARGLDALAERADVAFVSSTDAPLLHPAFVAAVLARLRPEDDICVPVLDGSTHHLAAAYRTSLAATVAELLAGDRLRLGLLLEQVRTRRVGAADLLADALVARLDPRLDSLRNVNGPEDYAAVRARPEPEVSVGALRVRAATLGRAAAAAGVALGEATLNGRPTTGDPLLPLVEGDALTFRAAD